ncbi:MAG: type II toxin-antitoxin system HipA family toxin, partial [Thermoleophilaceae bacterium]|nr:type II toxin-antitoxin system HipA family toxin [Thermoleophilaceae bacterium]
MTTTATVRLWGTDIGAVSIGDVGDAAIFQYEPTFVGSGIEVAPITMPLDHRIYTFPTLGWEAFRGLPGLLSDSLPDKYGNALIDTWLAAQGRTPESFNAVERLCYIGKRGMGALEFVPAAGPVSAHGDELQVAALVALASQVLAARTDLKLKLDSALTTDSLQDILSVGTSAGGARAKAVIAWNPSTQVVRSGQIEAGDGFEYWLLKLDGVSENRDKELADAKGYGAIEYAYSLMARAAGIEMAECRLLEEGGRKHFMTKRFDRRADGEKVHMQTLGAIAHFDLNLAGAYSYEQAIMVMRRLE